MKRKDRVSSRRAASLRPRKLILVVVEGETEECYFTLLKKKFKIHGLQVECELAEHPTPDAVIRSAMQAKAPRKLAYDERWIVYDADVSVEHGTLMQERQKAIMNDLLCAITNPCFEYWLLLHHECCTASFNSSKHCVRRLKEKDQAYRKGEECALQSYIDEDKIRLAIVHAEHSWRNHNSAGNDNPHPHPSTTVHVLVEQLLPPA